MNGPGLRGGDDEDNSNHCWLDGVAEGLIVVDVVALVEATDHLICRARVLSVWYFCLKIHLLVTMLALGG